MGVSRHLEGLRDIGGFIVLEGDIDLYSLRVKFHTKNSINFDKTTPEVIKYRMGTYLHRTGHLSAFKSCRFSGFRCGLNNF